MSTQRHARTAESGIALVTGLLAMVLIGFLVTGVLYFSMAEYRVGRNLLGQERALTVAEYGENVLLANWDSTLSTTMATGAVVTKVYSPAGGGVDTVSVTRLNSNLFWLVSVGSVSSGTAQARRRTNLILRAPTAGSMNIGAAITTGLTHQITLSGSATVVGVDGGPTNWGCPAVSDSVAGIAAPDTTNSNYTNSSSIPITGKPAIIETPTAADTMTYTTFGGMTYDSIAHLATKTYAAGANASSIAPATSSGVCTTATANWGEPWHAPTGGAVTACNNYFPIIHALGNFQFSSGHGQGIILVDGDFTASGGTEFDGLLIVKGAFTTSGGGIKLHGALFSRGNSSQQNTMSGSTQIQYSSCAIAAVTAQLGLGSKWVTPMKQRAWADFILTQ